MCKIHTNPHSAGILMPEESRTELIQFCDKKRLCGAGDFSSAIKAACSSFCNLL